jgi:hypothetical protein
VWVWADGASLPCKIESAPETERNTFERDTYEVRAREGFA